MPEFPQKKPSSTVNLPLIVSFVSIYFLTQYFNGANFFFNSKELFFCEIWKSLIAKVTRNTIQILFETRLNSAKHNSNLKFWIKHRYETSNFSMSIQQIHKSHVISTILIRWVHLVVTSYKSIVAISNWCVPKTNKIRLISHTPCIQQMMAEKKKNASSKKRR